MDRTCDPCSVNDGDLNIGEHPYTLISLVNDTSLNNNVQVVFPHFFPTRAT